MKNLIFNFAVIAAFISITILTGCESAAKKSDKADANVVAAKEELKDAQKTADAASLKAAEVEAWKTYKLENEVKINDNDVYIASLKADLKKTGKKMDAAYAKTIDELEAQNKALKERMNVYDKGQSNWEAFRVEFSKDMEGLGQALKNVTVNSKK
jgi:hypothetical protein